MKSRSETKSPRSAGPADKTGLEEDPAKLWSHYLLLVAVEEAFKNLKMRASSW
jgi:hypothetical protein